MEDRTFKCALCRTRLNFFQVHHLPGKTIYDPISGMRYDTGNNYCEKCFKEVTQQNEIEYETPLPSQLFGLEQVNEIKNLAKGQTHVNLIVDVADKQEKNVSKDGRLLRLGKFRVKDDSGEIELVLWEDIIDRVIVGDRLIVKNGFVRTFMNENQITLGKDGVLINLAEGK